MKPRRKRRLLLFIVLVPGIAFALIDCSSSGLDQAIDPAEVQQRFDTLKEEYYKKKEAGYDLADVDRLIKQLYAARDRKDWPRLVKLLDEIKTALDRAPRQSGPPTTPVASRSAAPEAPVLYPFPFGVFNDYVEEGSQRFSVRLAVELGNQVSRVQIPWNAVEPVQGQVQWAAADALLGNHRRAGIQVVATLLCISPWGTRTRGEARTATASPPLDPAQYQRFVRTMVDRYKSHVKYWQIDNEVFFQAFWSGSKEEYAELLKACHTTIKQADPEAKVVLAGLPGDLFFKMLEGDAQAREFFEFMLDKNRQYFDVVDLHQYYQPPDILTQVRMVREAFKRYGYSKEVIMTETGGLDVRLFGKQAKNPSHPIPIVQRLLSVRDVLVELDKLARRGRPTAQEVNRFAALIRTHDQSRPILERYQAEDLVQRFCLATASGVSQVHWVAMQDLAPERAMDWFHTIMGLVDPNGRKKPHFYTYRLLITKLKGFQRAEEIRTEPRVIRFSFAGRPLVCVAWSKRVAATLDLSDQFATSRVRLTRIITESGHTDRDAQTAVVSVRAIRVAGTPVFIEENGQSR